MIYREFAPAPALRRLVDRFWWLEGPAEAIAADPIPPDGRTEIIVHGGDPFAERQGSGWRTQDRVLLAGQASRAVHVAPRGYTRVVGARLWPAAAHALFGQPQQELTDHIADLRDIDRRLARRLAGEVVDLGDGRRMIRAFEAALVDMVDRSPASRAPCAAQRAGEIALARRGLVRVGDLAGCLEIGVRQLERLFKERIGLPPKLFLRILRFQQVLRTLRDGSGTMGWADFAVSHGFYDQAHFIRDFTAFAAESPAAFRVSDESLAAVFSEIRRAPGRFATR